MKSMDSIDWSKERPDLAELSNPFDIKIYIDSRALYKIKRYFLLSKRSEKVYKTIAILILALSASVPVILSLSIIDNKDLRILFATISSFLVVVLFSIESVYNFREQWKNYKNAEDEITQELNLFHSSAEPYNGEIEKNEKLLVLRVESIVVKERKETIEKLTSKIKELEKVPQVANGPS